MCGGRYGGNKIEVRMVSQKNNCGTTEKPHRSKTAIQFHSLTEVRHGLVERRPPAACPLGPGAVFDERLDTAEDAGHALQAEEGGQGLAGQCREEGGGAKLTGQGGRKQA